MHKSVEPLSDHPLFRALVLMGGALSTGCGGVAEREAPAGAAEIASGGSAAVSSAGSASGGSSSGAAAGANSLPGSVVATGGATVGPATQTGAGSSSTAGTNAGAFYNPACPYEQWDCTATAPAPSCSFGLDSTDDPRLAGCKCDTSRPTSAAACKADEQFVCRQAYPASYVEAQPVPPTWDGTLHIQCACVLAPVPTWKTCDATCVALFGAPAWAHCYLPGEVMCDERGVCTATSADVLRQDGIMCGCADIGLK